MHVHTNISKSGYHETNYHAAIRCGAATTNYKQKSTVADYAVKNTHIWELLSANMCRKPGEEVKALTSSRALVLECEGLLEAE